MARVLNFNTFNEVKEKALDSNFKFVENDNEVINVKEDGFLNLKYVEYGSDYVKFTEDGKGGYEDYKWLKVFENGKIEFGVTGKDTWWDEL